MEREHDNDVVVPWILAEEIERLPLPALPPHGPPEPPDRPTLPALPGGADEVSDWQLDDVVHRIPPGEPDVA